MCFYSRCSFKQHIASFEFFYIKDEKLNSSRICVLHLKKKCVLLLLTSVVFLSFINLRCAIEIETTFLVNVNKSAVSCGFFHIYWRILNLCAAMELLVRQGYMELYLFFFSSAPRAKLTFCEVRSVLLI